MGLILPQTVKVKIGSINYKYYKEKGYEFKKCGDIIEVNVLDLQRRSTTMVKCTCDFCGKITETWYGKVVVNKENNTLIACDNKDCMRKKKEDTNLKRYGVKNPSQAQEIKNKKVETCKKNFGCEYPAQSKIVQDKLKKAFQNHFGCNNPMQDTAIRNKAKATNIERYGVENFGQSSTALLKKKKTCLDNYGVDNPWKSNKVREKSKATMMSRYGYDNYGKSSKSRQYLRSDEFKAKRIKTLHEHGTYGKSQAEDRCYDLLQSIFPNAIHHYTSDVYPFECDMYVPELDLYIECNFFWTHGGHFFDENNPKDLATVEEWKSKHTNFYDSAIYNWTIRDLEKLECAHKNNLNYLVFWTEQGFIDWINT